jgi:hypothetical protein
MRGGYTVYRTRVTLFLSTASTAECYIQVLYISSEKIKKKKKKKKWLAQACNPFCHWVTSGQHISPAIRD